MIEMLTIGDPIKYRGKIFGVITEFYKDGYIGFVSHNGMKPVHNLASPEKLQLISKDRFWKYISRSGKNSLLEYLK